MNSFMTGENSPILSVKGLAKSYGNGAAYAIDHADFEVYGGDIFGFIGRNGAGKSTTIKCIVGAIPFTEGEILILGKDISTDYRAKQEIGYVSDDHAVYEFMTGGEYVDFIADIFGVGEERQAIVKDLVQRFDMEEDMNKLISDYSHGMKQKIAIIASLVHSPKLWILDEPITGLDVQMADEVKAVMKEYAAKGNAVFFSSHNIETVSELCSRVAIVVKSKLVDTVDIEDFKKSSKISLHDYFVGLSSENGEMENGSSSDAEGNG